MLPSNWMMNRERLAQYLTAFVLLLLLLIPSLSMAYLPEKPSPVGGPHYLRIVPTFQGDEFFIGNLLSSLGIIVDKITHEGIDLYANNLQFETLLSTPGLKIIYPSPALDDESYEWCDKENCYHSYEQLTLFMRNTADKYPGITTLHSIGKTVQGREMWFMRLGAPSRFEKPRFRYISTMHGDEIVGQEMCIYLIDYLASLYGKDPVVTSLMDQIDIWIMPNMNPDGTAKKRRFNSKWVDLNRDFPDFTTSDNVDKPDGRAIETQNLMNFTSTTPFQLSANYHGGALVINYPWDTARQDPPNLQFVVDLALGYSSRNLPMYNSPRFKNGITNGYAWYQVNGGMQDWMLYYRGELDYTVEVSGRKWPDPSKLAQFWEDNREAMLHLISRTADMPDFWY